MNNFNIPMQCIYTVCIPTGNIGSKPSWMATNALMVSAMGG